MPSRDLPSICPDATVHYPFTITATGEHSQGLKSYHRGIVNGENMVIKGVFVFAAASLLLAGCMNTREELAKRDDADCRAYGAKPGTQEYFQCRMAKDRNNSIAEAATAARSQAAISNFNNTVQQNSVPASAYNVPPMMPIGGSGRQCVSQPSGSGYITQCN